MLVAMREAPVTVVGEVVRQLHEQLFEVRLPNGKITLGHLSKKLKSSPPSLSAGDRVTLEMTPFDFDSGRISAVGG